VLQWSNRVDALVNNAGVADFAAIQDTTFERWQTVMRTNLDGVFLCSQAALPALRETRGCIVNIASISGLRASTLRVAYGTSKAAVIHLTKQQAAELGEWGIRVNCVSPGPVKTKLAAAVHTPAIVSAYHNAIPLNRYGSEEEIAQVIVFLASAEAGYVTGQMVAVDGGFDATGVGLPALRI
jgi:short-subunit dehydrogenase